MLSLNYLSVASNKVQFVAKFQVRINSSHVFFLQYLEEKLVILEESRIQI